jgi:hypothetical protein
MMLQGRFSCATLCASADRRAGPANTEGNLDSGCRRLCCRRGYAQCDMLRMSERNSALRSRAQRCTAGTTVLHRRRPLRSAAPLRWPLSRASKVFAWMHPFFAIHRESRNTHANSSTLLECPPMAGVYRSTQHLILNRRDRDYVRMLTAAEKPELWHCGPLWQKA